MRNMSGMLKSLFCWRGHCDVSNGTPPYDVWVLKSLFCWRGHCDCSSKPFRNTYTVEILVLLEGALRPGNLGPGHRVLR